MLISDWELLVLVFKGLERPSLRWCDYASSGKVKSEEALAWLCCPIVPRQGGYVSPWMSLRPLVWRGPRQCAAALQLAGRRR